MNEESPPISTPQSSKSKVWFLILTAVISAVLVTASAAVFFLSRLDAAANKPLWLDENHAIKMTFRRSSYLGFLVGDVKEQASPAPLDHAINKFRDQIRNRVNWHGVVPSVYYRVFPITAVTLGALAAFFLFLIDILRSTHPIWMRSLQSLCLPFAIIAFLFQPFLARYAVEMRPYALWTSLYFLCLSTALLDFRHNKKFFLTALILLAFTATASIFQLVTLAAAYFIVERIKKGGFKVALKNTAWIFAAPLCISVFYCLRAPSFGHPYQDIWRKAFFELWDLHASIVPMMLLLCVFCLLKKENRSYAVSPMAYMFMFLCAPIIFLAVLIKGQFFHERYLIFFVLTNALFLLVMIKCLPAYLSSIRTNAWKVCIFVCILLVSACISLRRNVPVFLSASLNRAEKVLFDYENTNIPLEKANPNEISYWDSDIFIRF